MITLTEAQMPNHTHTLTGSGEDGNSQNPGNHHFGAGTDMYHSPSGATLVPAAEQTLPNTGGSQAHNNLQPFLTMNFIIALQGLYPSRG